MAQSIHDLWYGFSVAIQPGNFLWCVFGVLIGNLVGVLPGMGALATLAILLPLTYSIPVIPAILMLSGIFYGSMYGGAIGAILLNLPSHPPHAVTCLDGYPLTLQNRGGAALGIAMIASFFAASVGILIMVFVSPLLVDAASQFGPADIASIMLLGLLAGATMARGSPLRGIATTLLGLVCGLAGTDTTSGTLRFTFGLHDLSDGIELGALCMGLFGIADFLTHVNHPTPKAAPGPVRFRDVWPTRDDLKRSFLPMLRGTAVGTAFGAMPGTGPTITTFIAYAIERKVSRTPERFGKGAIEGVASPEAAAHSKTQVDFIPTMTLGIPGDPIMALILGALIIKGVQPGPQLITDHPDLFWGLVASFWIGNILLMVLNMPLIGVWVKLLQVPFRFLFPTAILFICIGVYAARNNLFDIYQVAFFGVVGAACLLLRFPLAPIVLGYVLGPMLEEDIRRALTISQGDLTTFIGRPISAIFVAASAVLIVFQIVAHVWAPKSMVPATAPILDE